MTADVQCENALVDYLQRESSYPILTEESGEIGDFNAGGAYWVIDPLDGSLNYSRGIPFFAISVALWQSGKPLLGVVYDVVNEEVYTSIVGQGAWCNRQEISVSSARVPREAVLATGFPVYGDFGEQAIMRLVHGVMDFKKVRLLGSAAMSLAYVARGRIDAYAEQGIMIWDVAAGLALVEAAGGVVAIRPSERHRWALDVRCAASPALLEKVG